MIIQDIIAVAFLYFLIGFVTFVVTIIYNDISPSDSARAEWAFHHAIWWPISITKVIIINSLKLSLFLFDSLCTVITDWRF